MQKALFIVIFIAICFQLDAQILTTKQTKVLGDFIEEFYVLQMDTSVKHGLYKKQTTEKLLIEKGYYNNGKRVGKWLFYYKKEDVYEEGDLKTIRNYDSPDYGPWSACSFLNLDGDSIELDYPPRFLGGKLPPMFYPRKARRVGAESDVSCIIIIDEKGIMSFTIEEIKLSGELLKDELLINDIQNEFYSMAEKYLKSINRRWIPAIKEESFIAVRFKYLLKFAIR